MRNDWLLGTDFPPLSPPVQSLIQSPKDKRKEKKKYQAKQKTKTPPVLTEHCEKKLLVNLEQNNDEDDENDHDSPIVGKRERKKTQAPVGLGLVIDD